MVRGTVRNTSDAERAELESVLQSRILLRSPSVLRIAQYIVRIYLDGGAKDIKEYNIAVDALGKPVDFDPKRDSIVRVEVHRLRKKLDEFYRTEGADHTLRLVIDPGRYIPRFESAVPVASPIADVPDEVPPPVTIPVTIIESPPPSAPPRRWFLSRRALLVPLALLLALLAWSGWRSRAVTVPDPIYMIAGAPANNVAGADTGVIWQGDRWFSGGTAVYPGPPFPVVPEASHTGQRLGNFDYAIPLAGVPWELRLYFGPRAGVNETPGRIGRGFDVFANGVRLLNGQDPDLGSATSEQSVIRVFRDIRPGPDNLLHLSFRNGREVAYVSAIGLSPGEAGRLLPIRLISKAAPWSDIDGHTWIPDGEFVTGGKLKLRSKLDPGGLDRNLVGGERYGAFSYRIPVSKGTYRLKLYFAESWFGPGLKGGGGIGSRRFDVYAEGQPLLQDFDIFREAGHKPLLKEFHGLKTNADGYIGLTFVPRANYAAVNALELVEEPG